MGPFRACWAIAALAGILLGTGCGSSSTPPAAKASAAHTVAGGPANCPPSQAQDLTFTGGFVGHLTCQAKPSFCFWDPPKADLTNSLHNHLSANIPVFIDGKPATVSVSPGKKYGEGGLGPGTYEVPSSHPAESEPQFSLQLADLSIWTSQGTGQVVVLTDDGKRVTGTVKGTIAGTSTATLSGGWACTRGAA